MHRVQRCTRVTNAAVNAAKRVLAYLKGTKELGIEYSVESEEEFRRFYRKILRESNNKDQLADCVMFSDSDFAGCSMTLKSTSGVILYYRGTPLAWSSKLQTLRAQSTTEAEYIAAHDALFIRDQQGFLEWFLEEGADIPFNLFVDNQSALKVSKQVIHTKKSKHFALRLMKVRDNAEFLAYVPTGVNLADPLTKPLARPAYINMLRPVHGQHGAEAHVAETDDDFDSVRVFYVDFS